MLAGDVAIVTGGASGIGRACAVTLAGADAKVALIDMNLAGAQEAADEIREAGGDALAIEADSSVEEAVDSAVERALGELGPVTILINAAGTRRHNHVLDTPVEDWRRILDVNLHGYFLFVHAVLPSMLEAGGGRIVQIASVAGHVGMGSIAYSTSKAAVITLTETLGRELAAHNIRVNSISPGIIETNFNRDRLSDPAVREASIAEVPMGRLGRPQDVADAALFLVGPGAAYITATDLMVAGGYLPSRPMRARSTQA